MEDQKIPVSVGILTLNNAKEIAQTFEALKAFRDVYICDGNSTDGTQDIARQHDVRVTKQVDTDEPFQRIESFGATRTRCMNAAQEAWYFRLDSDERLSPEAVEEIREIVSNPHPPYLVYKIPRKYVLRGKVIDQCVTYPNRQVRFFRRDAVLGYSKMTHERVDMKPGVRVGFLKHPMLVPLPDDYAGYWKKFENGLRFDAKQHAHISLYSYLFGTVHATASVLLYTYRLIRTWILPGNKMPFAYDWARFKYQGKVWWLTTKSFFG